MKPQHTPGPWQAVKLSNIGHYAIVGRDGETICNPSPMGEVNARIITAAPDLLLAAEIGLRYTPDTAGSGRNTIINAIRHARGE